MVSLLVESPSLRVVTIFDELCRHYRNLPAGVRRILERRVRRWRALHGPEQEDIFAQRHPPDCLGLSDFTATGDLGVTIAGVPLTHLLYHFRLPYSGVEYADVVLGGESFVALSGGCQNALWLLGAVPEEHRTDSLSPPTTTSIKPPVTISPAATRSCATTMACAPRATTAARPTRTAASKAPTATSSAPSNKPCCCAAPVTSTTSLPMGLHRRDRWSGNSAILIDRPTL